MKLEINIYIFNFIFFINIFNLIILTEGSFFNDDSGYFWQLSDLHYDANYSKQSSCIGSLGNYLCDAPWSLVNSSLYHMHIIKSDPDFILWTGDTVAHVNDSDIDPIKISNVIHQVSQQITSFFPGVSIIPLLGNHDWWPANQIPANTKDKYYEQILTNSDWIKWLHKDSVETFIEGGYYSVELNDDLLLLAINSNVWYMLDNQTAIKDTDPLNQFGWLERKIIEARNLNKKVLLIGHVPPGMFGRSAGTFWMKKFYNDRFYQFLIRNTDIITTAIFGHEHTDAFKLIFDGDWPKMTILLAPSVTPWLSSIPNVGSNNPSIRLYKYSKTNGRILDYDQYYLDLTETNLQWKKAYSFLEEYHLMSMKPEFIYHLYRKMECTNLFDKYYKFNSALHDSMSVCNDECRLAHLCAIRYINYVEYNACILDINGFQARCIMEWHRNEVAKLTYIMLLILVAVVIIVFLIVSLCCYKRRPHIPYTQIVA